MNDLIVTDKNQALELARGLEIKDEQIYFSAVEFCGELKKAIKDVKLIFDPEIAELRKPYQEKLDEKNDALDKFQAALKLADGKVMAWVRAKEEENRKIIEEQKRLEREQAEKQRLIEEEANKAGIELVPEPILPLVEPVIQAIQTPVGTSFREEWDFEIVNFAEVQDDYKLPNDKAIRAIVKSLGDKAPVGGIRVFRKKIMVQR